MTDDAAVTTVERFAERADGLAQDIARYVEGFAGCDYCTGKLRRAKEGSYEIMGLLNSAANCIDHDHQD